MTERETIAAITARLEERLAARLVDRIRPLLAGRSAEVQRAVLTELAAELIAGGRAKDRSRSQQGGGRGAGGRLNMSN